MRFEHINTVPLAPPYSYRLKRILLENEGRQLLMEQSEDSDEGTHRFLAEAANDEARLRELGFTVHSNLCMVLGRLFKLHPEFDAVLSELIWRFHADSSHGGFISDADGPFIVLIAEDLSELNEIVYHRLLQATQRRLDAEIGSSAPAGAAALLRRHVKVVGYGYYHTLLRSARVVLDTFPYGGKYRHYLFMIQDICH